MPNCVAWREGHILQPTALINEAFLRLINWKNVSWQNRAHFFGVSAQLMRRILVDFARSRNAKRRVAVSRVILNEALGPAESSTDVVAVDEALKSLEALDPRKAKIVELRFFGGLGIKETAEFLKISTDTVEREWNLTRAWLLRELRKGSPKAQASSR